MRGPQWFVAALIVASPAWVSADPQQVPTTGRGAVQVPVAVPPPPQPTGVLAGRITNAVTKAPVARARVLLSADCETPTIPGGPACKPVLPQNRVVVTGEDGRFRFTALPAAPNFVIRATATGYAPTGYGELPPALRPAFLALKPAEVLETANVELAPEVVLSGAVQDEDGRPLEGALVEALRATFVEGRRELVTVAEAVSDDRGQFRLTQMPPGQYYVSAFDPAFANVGDADGQLFYSPTYYPSATTPDEASRITLELGVSREAIVIKVRLIKPARVGGSLKPAMDLPLGSGAIELGPKRNDPYASLSSYRVDIRPDGSFLFANIPPGQYVIRARGETAGDNISMFGNFTIEMSGSDRPGINITMNQGAIVSGSVEWDRRNRGRIPADRTTMIIRAPMPDGSLSGDSPTGNVQPNDTFVLKGVLQGSHYIRVENLPPGWSLKRVEFNGADVTDNTVEFVSGRRETTLKVILTDTSTVVFGSILPARGDVLHGYAVVAFSTNPLLWYPRSRQVVLQRPLDLKGHYRIDTLPAGEYYLAVMRDVDESDIFDARTLKRLAQVSGLKRIRLKDGEQILVDLPPLPLLPGAQ